LDLIDADGIDLAKGAVFQAPGDDMLDRVENLFPGSAECLCSFFPREAASPAGQEEHVHVGQGVFAVAPGNFFDDDGVAAAAIDASHGVQQEDEVSPERDELEAALVELVVTGRRQAAARADRGRSLARPHGKFDALVVRTEACAMIDKSAEAMAAV
jgi:hypothetical protein